MTEKLSGISNTSAFVLRGSKHSEHSGVHGKFIAKCYDKNGNLKWEDTINNVVTDVGANFLLDGAFGAAQNTKFYLGLISSVGYTGIPIAADTMASHATTDHVWVEAGNGSNYPTWSTPASNARQTIVWAAANARAKALNAALSFVMDHDGTVEGCFVVTGSAAVTTNANTSGTLYSAGVFSGGAKVLQAADTLTVSYSTSV
jgi:hypothetical protein